MDNSDFAYEILVVDDILEAAQDYARLISSKTGLTVISTSDPEKALQIVQHNDIKVLVLDQKMPKMTGTELLRKLREFTRARALMLTGEADIEDLGNAINMNFSAHVNKSQVMDLPSSVLHQYTMYCTDFEAWTKNCNKKFIDYRISLKNWDIERIFQIEDVVISSCEVDENQRQTLYQIFSGQDKEIVSEVQAAQEFIIESSIEHSIGMNIKNTANDIISVFENSMKKILKVSKHISKSQFIKHTTRYHLTEEDSKRIDHRIIECAPTYEVHKITMFSKSLRAKKIKSLTGIVKSFTGYHYFYQIDYLKDGNINNHDLGKHRIKDLCNI